MAGMEATDGCYLGLVLGKCEALASTDGSHARDLFLATATSHGLTVHDYSQIVSRLMRVRAFDPAIDILGQAAKAFPDDPKVEHMGQVVRAAREKTGDTDAHVPRCCLSYL